MKPCVKCGATDRVGSGRCRPCMSRYSRRYYEENREKRAEYNRRYREENREKRAEYNRRYYEENREKRAEYVRRYCENNPVALRASNARNRSRWKAITAPGAILSRQKWTPAEDALVLATLRTHTAIDVAVMLGRTCRSIHHRRRLLRQKGFIS